MHEGGQLKQAVGPGQASAPDSLLTGHVTTERPDLWSAKGTRQTTAIIPTPSDLGAEPLAGAPGQAGGGGAKAASTPGRMEPPRTARALAGARARPSVCEDERHGLGRATEGQGSRERAHRLPGRRFSVTKAQ